MSVSTTMRNAMAIGLLRLYRGMERSGTYSNRDMDAVTLYMDYQPESIELAEQLGLDTEKTTRKFFVPRQANFPPTDGVNIEDEIVVEGKTYSVLKVEQAGDDSPQLELTCQCNRAVSGGTQ